MGHDISSKKGHSRTALFLFFLICGLLVFLVSMTYSPNIPDGIEIAVRMGFSAVFLVLALMARRSERFNPYWRVFYAFFVASLALILSWKFGGSLLEWLNLDVSTPQGIAVAKLSETLWLVLPILVLIKLSGAGMGSIYLQKGRLKLGLTFGVIGFVMFALLAFPIAEGLFKGQELGLARVILWVPWILIFVLANGLNEELLFRGLFLRNYQGLFGSRYANLLTAIVFTLGHVQVTYTPDVLSFLVILMVLALAWGHLMLKTDSVWGSALFHAGADIPVVIGIYSTLS